MFVIPVISTVRDAMPRTRTETARDEQAYYERHAGTGMTQTLRTGLTRAGRALTLLADRWAMVLAAASRRKGEGSC